MEDAFGKRILLVDEDATVPFIILMFRREGAHMLAPHLMDSVAGIDAMALGEFVLSAHKAFAIARAEARALVFDGHDSTPFATMSSVVLTDYSQEIEELRHFWELLPFLPIQS